MRTKGLLVTCLALGVLSGVGVAQLATDSQQPGTTLAR